MAGINNKHLNNSNIDEEGGGGEHSRKSNLELLRIVSMILVLLVHYVGTVPITLDSIHDNWLLSTTTIFLHSISVICVNCFILISGYFGITWKLKSFLSLLYQILFWLILVYIIATALGCNYKFYGLLEIGKFFGNRWFVPAYIGLYMLSPIINAFVEKVESNTLGIYILLFYLYSTIIGYFLHSHEFDEGMSVISLVGLYLIGAYLKRTDLKIFQLKASYNLIIYLLIALSLGGLNIALLYLGISNSPFGYLNPIVIIMSIFLFLFFQKLNIGYIKLINWIAASAFAVFLFHHHPAVYGIYQDVCKHIITQGYLAPIWLTLFFFALFGVTVLIDQIRIVTFRLLYH